MEDNQQENELTPVPTSAPPTEVRIGNFMVSIENDKVLPAFVDALNEIEAAVKDSVNPHLKNKYADLSSCLAVIKPALKKYGMALAQPPVLSEDMKALTIGNVVFHKSGQYIRWDLTMPIATAISPQQVGTLITYCRRYSGAGLGISAEDDDGNSSSNVTGPSQQQRREPPPPPPGSPLRKTEAKPKQEAAKPVEEKPQPKPEPQTELGAYLSGGGGGGDSEADELQQIITAITQKHTGVTPTAIDRFMETTGIKKQSMELQVAFMRKYSENRDFSMVATQWTRTGKSFQECFDEAVAKGPTVWRDSIKSA